MSTFNSNEVYFAQTPVAYFFYNRPDLIRQTFQEIAKAKPKKLFLIADGAKDADDEKFCKISREVVKSAIDWPCEVYNNFSSTHLGLGERVASGIAWVFEKVEEAIFIEDDVLVHNSFFQYCDLLLDYHRNNLQVMMISGCNLFPSLSNETNNVSSYLFSRYPMVWGWATWKRAWSNYDLKMQEWPHWKNRSDLSDYFVNKEEERTFQFNWERVYSYGFDTWTFQWDFCRVIARGLGLIPKKNLAVNIGFGESATHTKDSSSFLAHLPLQTMEFPLHHQREDAILHDQAYFKKMIKRASFLQRALLRISQLFSCRSETKPKVKARASTDLTQSARPL
ncbi:MAG: glycosyltransferase family 2 protein [Oligoflexia bacterium]|nr:glycosyltransferase family 2 protein [Oligoflexia bacterium]MBF0367186.1 glycosyltransferase family 2 protein [Oligoflexia bacterium]